MSKGIQKILVVFSALVIGITFGLLTNTVHALELVEIIRDESVCGNGVREGGEQCDHGADNGTEGDLCLADCKWDLDNIDQECVEEKFSDCFEPEPVPEDELILVEAAEEAAPLDEIEETEENPIEECIEWAIEECRDDPEDPEDPQETPEVKEVEEEEKAIEPNNPLFFEGSGGCTLVSTASGPQSLGLLLGLGFGFVPVIARRFKK